MQFFKTALIMACILIPPFCALNHFGLMVSKSGIFMLCTSYSFPTRWKGKLAGTSGFMRRNYVVFQKYSTLAIEYETTSGSIQVEVNSPNGSALSPASGVYGRNCSVLIDVSRLKRCSVSLKMDHFNGNFCIALQ